MYLSYCLFLSIYRKISIVQSISLHSILPRNEIEPDVPSLTSLSRSDNLLECLVSTLWEGFMPCKTKYALGRPVYTYSSFCAWETSTHKAGRTHSVCASHSPDWHYTTWACPGGYKKKVSGTQGSPVYPAVFSENFLTNACSSLREEWNTKINWGSLAACVYGARKNLAKCNLIPSPFSAQTSLFSQAILRTPGLV